MILPERIETLLTGKTGHADGIGMSGSFVAVYDDCVLKVERESPTTAQSVATMQWLGQRLNVPKVLAHEILDGCSFLLMSRIPGKMSCDSDYLAQPEVVVRELAQGLKLLWQTDPTGCPRDFTLEVLLEEAAYRVENGLVDLDNVEPDTFGEKGFRDPQALLQWLKENRPSSVPVLAHGDYCLPNVFLENGKLSGFIDIGDMGIGEKWRDIALCWRSLKHNFDGSYGGPVYPDFDPDVLFDALGIEPDPQQLHYHLLLDELF